MAKKSTAKKRKREKNIAKDEKRWKIHRKISFVKQFLFSPSPSSQSLSFVFDAGVIVVRVVFSTASAADVPGVYGVYSPDVPSLCAHFTQF